MFQLESPVTSSSELAEMADASVKLSRPVIINTWSEEEEKHLTPPITLFTNESKALIWGMQPRAVQVEKINASKQI